MEVLYFYIFLLIVSFTLFVVDFFQTKAEIKKEREELIRILAWNAAKSAEEKLRSYPFSESLSNDLDNYTYRHHNPII